MSTEVRITEIRVPLQPPIQLRQPIQRIVPATNIRQVMQSMAYV